MVEEKIDINKIITIENIDFNNPEITKELFRTLLNFIEIQQETIQIQKKEIQELKDEINKLKGEKGKPDIKAGKKDNPEKKEVKRESNSNWKKNSKKDRVKIDRTEIVTMDKSKLPFDAEFKGYREVIIQNVKIETDNVLYRIPQWYSSIEGKTYSPELPEHLKGTEFGPELKAFCSMLYYECRVTEHLIAKLLNANGILISEGTISNILIKESAEELTKEKEEIYDAAVENCEYMQIDDTGIRVNGKNAYGTVVCNEKCTLYYIKSKKNRVTVREILRKSKNGVTVKNLVCDDAAQFHTVTEVRQLCWVHEERHYEKLIPILPYHKTLVEKKISEIWVYYGKLKAYKLNPKNKESVSLSEEFDIIFNKPTGYEALDKRLYLTLVKKEYLLAVLKNPKLPLHNNVSEDGARKLVMKRKVSGGVRTEEGKIAWENNLTILETCKKLKVNFYDYIKAIFSKKTERIKLSNLIAQ
jgi:hypothetical protein